MKRISGGGLLWAAAVILLLFPPDIRAHNGAATVAVPVAGIVVDGDLSDWPDDLEWNRLQYFTWDLLENSDDLQGRFAVGYSAGENALYVAVEVRDESLVVEGENPEWNAVDGCELYVDTGHSEESVSVDQYQITSTVPGIFGNVRREDFSVVVQRDAGSHRYEWRVDIDGHSRGKMRLQSGMVLGLDVSLRDKDADGSFTQTAWGAKWRGNRFDSESLGDVMLASSQGDNGRVEGRLVRMDGRGDAYRCLELRSMDDSQQWLLIRGDEDGGFALTLAAGRYHLKAGSLSEFNVEVEVKPGSEVQLAEGVIPPPRGREVEAGPGRKARARGRTLRAGPGRWEGAWRTLGVADGIPDATVTDVFQDRDGSLWFATGGGGVARYDGEEMTVYTAADGLVGDQVSAISQGMNGDLWFAMSENLFGVPGGVSRFDGIQFTTFTIEDGLPGNEVSALIQDAQGRWWFGTHDGLCLFDGERFITFTIADGLSSDQITALALGREGDLWIGTANGVSRFDGRQDVGESFTCFTTADGLSHNHVLDVMEDRQGHLWFSTFGGGVSRYDGRVFQSLLQRDGLVHNGVHEVVEGRDGSYWIATEGGFTRYRPRISPPRIRITRIVAGRDFPPDAPIRLPTTQNYLAFEFQGSSFKTRPDQIAYVYRLDGYDADWRVTRQRQVVYRDLPVGEYLFEVQAVDRDLTYSEESATVEVEVHLPYGQMVLWGLLGLALAGALVSGRVALNRRRERDQAREELMIELEEELQTAHEMQMRLMPEESPQIPGFDVAGVCIPANHVGGDFFQYFPEDGKLGIAMADVTGHAMEAAVPVMMFSGLLKTEIKHAARLEDLFVSLNQTLCDSLESRTYVCFVMLELDLADLTLRLSNSGCPYPFHFRAATGAVEEVQVDAYPLGVRADSRYPVVEVQLEPGDRIVFCSDGIVEAGNEAEELFGFERTIEAVRRGCVQGLSGAVLVEQMLEEVKQFSVGVSQEDDQTIVVLGVGMSDR